MNKRKIYKFITKSLFIRKSRLLDMINISLEENFKELAIKNSHALDEMLKNDLPEVKEKSISPELKGFWSNFENELINVKKLKQGNQVLNAYINLSENRSMINS
ncbi:MAG: hypothetical protein LBV42_00095 [Methanobrevibacter sp.]|jgi:hypothetical protein|nr:hypothetical protein [Methanobrevibacter sp.]